MPLDLLENGKVMISFSTNPNMTKTAGGKFSLMFLTVLASCLISEMLGLPTLASVAVVASAIVMACRPRRCCDCHRCCSVSPPPNVVGLMRPLLSLASSLVATIETAATSTLHLWFSYAGMLAHAVFGRPTAQVTKTGEACRVVHRTVHRIPTCSGLSSTALEQATPTLPPPPS